jgi:hypothetical protein
METKEYMLCSVLRIIEFRFRPENIYSLQRMRCSYFI